MVSLSVVSEIAIVPESECSTPTLIGSAHVSEAATTGVAAVAASTRAEICDVSFKLRSIFKSLFMPRVFQQPKEAFVLNPNIIGTGTQQ